MGQFHFKPDDYLELMRSEVPAYELLQNEVIEAADGLSPLARVLELGTGSGETSRRLLERYPEARLTGIDASEGMLAAAGRVLPMERVDALHVGDIAEPLPEGPFDLVVSALTIHHLDGSGKAELFGRIARVLRPGGRFVMGDVVVPADPADAITPLTPDYDMPDETEDLLGWLSEAGFEPSVTWAAKDLAVIAATLV